MKPIKHRKLKLDKTTIVQLTANALTAVAGGAVPETRASCLSVGSFCHNAC
jgi:hypothetical protein